jgi:hypothetical protein
VPRGPPYTVYETYKNNEIMGSAFIIYTGEQARYAYSVRKLSKQGKCLTRVLRPKQRMHRLSDYMFAQ